METTSTKSASVCSLVRKRQYGLCGSFAFERSVSRFLQDDKELLMDPELVSPHRSAISSLDVDPNLGRFVLVGSADATVSVYDLSHWGSEGFARKLTHPSSFMRFRPVARSMKVPLGFEENQLDVPSGHSASITHVQWYPVDTGAFLSSASDGCILLWDTNRMQPVLRVMPFAESLEDTTGVSWGSAHLQTGGDHSLIATGSYNDSTIKLVDIRSGASSHQLTGHTKGISALQWSPSMPLVFASGSNDSTIRLWDIRKSGSQACIAVFNRELSSSKHINIQSSYHPDYTHLRRFAAALEKKATKKRKLGRGVVAAPNNYHHVQSKGGLQSHNGHVAALSFLPGGQSLASIGGADGDLQLWDLRNGPTLMDRKFLAPDGLNAASPTRRKATLCVDSHGTLWVGHKTQVLGFSVEGGSPTQILRGHLNSSTSLAPMEMDKQLLSGSQDGMILCWGKPKASLFTRRPILTQDKDNW